MDYRVYEVNTDENGYVLSARCVLENGFQYAIISFPKGALMAEMEERLYVFDRIDEQDGDYRSLKFIQDNIR